ncbi:MAG: HAD family hydrolase [Clostridia bacterium]|nr:HAD family hydrolase [Clostridia bacterium]
MMDTKKIRWIFFDVGGTLVDETESFRRRVQRTIAMQKEIGNEYTEEQLENAMREAALSGGSYFRGAMKNIGLSPVAPYDAIGERLYPETQVVLKALSAKYKLGIIANQPMGTAKRLQTYGISEYISLVLSSAEEGVEKPEPIIFLSALERADCKAEEAVMIGDRPDNDILPAKRLGMKTIRITQGLGGLMPVRNEEMQADATVRNLNELLNILYR